MRISNMQTIKNILFACIVCISLPNCAELVNGLSTGSLCDKKQFRIFGIKEVSNLFGTCSGNGECVENNTECECDDTWTGLSDFVNTEGIDCQINVVAIRVIWSLVLLSFCVTQRKAIPAISIRWRSYRNYRDSMASGLRNENSLLKNRVLLACLVYELISVPVLFIFIILRFKTDERVGVTVAPTVLLALYGVSFYLVHYLYEPTVIETVLAGSSLDPTPIQNALKFNRCTAIVHDAFSILKWIIPFFALRNNDGNDEYIQSLWKLYVGLHCVTMYFVGVQAVYAMYKIRIVFRESIVLHTHETKKKHLENIKCTLLDVQKNFVKQGFIFGSLYLILLLTPHLWNKYDYFLPITCIGMNLGATKLIVTLPKEEDLEWRASAATSTKVDSSESKLQGIDNTL